MDIITLPTSDTPHVTQSTSLGGRVFQLKFDWNSRLDKWMLSIYDEDGVGVLEGHALIPYINLLRTVAMDRAPEGELMLFADATPTLESLSKALLVFLPEEEFPS